MNAQPHNFAGKTAKLTMKEVHGYSEHQVIVEYIGPEGLIYRSANDPIGRLHMISLSSYRALSIDQDPQAYGRRELA